MSLIFDALRQQGTQSTQKPTRHGSIVTPHHRPLTWGLAAILLLLVFLGSIFWQDVNRYATHWPSTIRESLSKISTSEADSASEPNRSAQNGTIKHTLAPPLAGVTVESSASAHDTPAASSKASHQSRLSSTTLAQQASTSHTVRKASTETLPTTPSTPTPETPPATPAPAAQQPAVATDTSRSTPTATPTNAAAEAPVTTATPSTSKISPAELFSTFNVALGASQLPKAKAVIERARDSLGDSHLIVARLQGYYCMQADCPEQARQAYTTILSRLPRDREAGYNLAILDWQANRRTAAFDRVHALLAQYPEDQSLQALKRRMGAQ